MAGVPRCSVVVLGQTPPPYHGQAVMIQRMLEGDYGAVQLVHVRMNYSTTIEDLGNIQVRKLLELFRVILRALQARFSKHATVLYYPPAGPRLVPILRDLLTLIVLRPFFDKTIFHFHAGGLSELYEHLPTVLRPLFRAAYFKPDAAIRLSPLTPDDARLLQARTEHFVPYGISDHYEDLLPRNKQQDESPKILFVGMLAESKGVRVVLEACRLLAEQGQRFHITLVGAFTSADFEISCQKYVEAHGLSDLVCFPGVLTGDAKWAAYAEADIFCFPSHYESEAFPVVLLEALSFGLPIVTTHWRGIPSVVNETCAFLVSPRDPQVVADRLSQLLQNAELHQRMSEQSRRRFLDYFTLNKFHERMKDVFEAVCAEVTPP